MIQPEVGIDGGVWSGDGNYANRYVAMGVKPFELAHDIDHCRARVDGIVNHEYTARTIRKEIGDILWQGNLTNAPG